MTDSRGVLLHRAWQKERRSSTSVV